MCDTVSPRTVFEESGLEVEPPAFEDFTERIDPSEQVRRRWSGKLEDASIKVVIRMLSTESFNIVSPEDVRRIVGSGGFGNLEKPFEYEESVLRYGNFGIWPYAAVGSGQLARPSGPVDFVCLAGLLEGKGYAVEIEIAPAGMGRARKAVWKYLDDAIRYHGPKPDPQWTDEEALARWNRDAAHYFGDPKIHRTKHYIFITNSSGAKSFGRKFEETYTKVRKLVGLKGSKNQRLLPVLLFRTEEQYRWFSRKYGAGLFVRGPSVGHATGDYYATWYESPGDPVHIFGATLQFLSNVAGLEGGGRWLRAGLAEYLSTRENERDSVANRVKKGDGPTLWKLMREDVFGFYNGFSEVALAIEFFCESKSTKKKFGEFVRALGAIENGGVADVDAIAQDLWGLDLPQLEELFVKYCKRR